MYKTRFRMLLYLVGKIKSEIRKENNRAPESEQLRIKL